MKHVTHIIFCMLCMLCLFDATAVAQVNSSDEFFTLYFKDGTSRNFYTGDITAITHSNIDLDGTIYEEPVVQEICMGTEVERYRLADIEEMSFERLNLPFDVRAYMKEWDDIHAVVDDLFMECDIIEELQKHKEEILALANVKDVYFDVKQGFMEVTLNDGTSQSWDYPIYGPDDEGSSRDELFAKAESKVKALAESNANVHKPSNGKKVWIGNMLDSDQASNFVRGTKYLKELVGKLEKLGFKVDYTDKWDFDEASTSDIILFVTHGGYNDSLDYHYINTGIHCRRITDVLDKLSKDTPGYAIGSTKINIGVKPNGEYVKAARMYFKIATQFIKDQVNLKDSAVVFMGACSTIDNKNNTFARAFTENGASSYIGFDNKTYIPAYLGAAFVYQLAKDKSVSESFDYVAKSMGEMSTDKEWPWNKDDAKAHDEAGQFGGMKIQYRKNDSSYGNLCFNHSSFSTAKPEECNIGETSAYLGVKIQNLDGLKQLYGGLQEIGVMYTPDKDNWTGTNVKKITFYEYSWKEGVIRGQTLGKLQMEKEYWYRAYLKTGAGVIVLGEVEKFVTNDKEAREELKKIYEQIGDKSWHNWLDEQTPITNWDFVYLSNEGIGYNVDVAYVYYSKDNPNVVLKDLKRIHSISFPCVSNNSKLESLTISNCPNLEKIPNMRTKHLKIDSCKKLRSFSFYSDVATLDLTNCPKIVDLNVDYTENMESIRIANCSSLEELSAESSNLRSLEIKDCPLLKKLNLFSSKVEGVLNLSGAPNLEELDCSFSKVTRLIITSRVLSSLECLNAPIDQTIESIPNWEFFEWEINQNRKFVYDSGYAESDDLIQLQKDGWKILQKETKGDKSYYVIYKYNYDDHHGFYHEGEPSVEAYYTWW